MTRFAGELFVDILALGTYLGTRTRGRGPGRGVACALPLRGGEVPLSPISSSVKEDTLPDSSSGDGLLGNPRGDFGGDRCTLRPPLCWRFCCGCETREASGNVKSDTGVGALLLGDMVARFFVFAGDRRTAWVVLRACLFAGVFVLLAVVPGTTRRPSFLCGKEANVGIPAVSPRFSCARSGPSEPFCLSRAFASLLPFLLSAPPISSTFPCSLSLSLPLSDL